MLQGSFKKERKKIDLKHCVFQFQVTILEAGARFSPGVGVVKGDKYKTTQMPGWREESLGYHTDIGEIYYNNTSGRETKGLFGNSVNEFKNVVVSDC